MRVNVYAEELTDRVELVTKTVEGQAFTAIRFYLELPATVAGPDGLMQCQGPFIHRPGDDDSAAVTFWGKQNLRPLLQKALALLDQHYGVDCLVPLPGAPDDRWRDVYLAARGKAPVETVIDELERQAIVELESVPGEAKVRKFALMPEMILEAVGLNVNGQPHDYCRVVTSDLPADFQMRHAYWDHVNHRLIVVGTSETFTPIDITQEAIPEITPTMTAEIHRPESGAPVVNYGPPVYAVLVCPGPIRGYFNVFDVILRYHPDDGAVEAARLTTVNYWEKVDLEQLGRWLDVAAAKNANGVYAPDHDLEIVMADIRAERRNQDKQWGGPAHDDSHERIEWSRFIEKQDRKAQAAALRSDAVAFEQCMTKLAALAVAAIQSSRRQR